MSVTDVAADAAQFPVREPVLGVIFAGGASRRFGSDKALASLGGLPLLARVAERLRPQVDELALSGPLRGGIAWWTIPDHLPGSGPMAALRSVLRHAARAGFPLVITACCDTPFIPRDIVHVLYQGLGGCDCSIPSFNATLQPACALWRTAARIKVDAAFEAGERSLHGAIAYTDANIVEYPRPKDRSAIDPFFNINTRSDMSIAQSWDMLEEDHGNQQVGYGR